MGKLKWVVGIMGALGGAAWLGTKIQPEPFAPPSDPGHDLGMVDLPDDLPKPVHRYLQAVTLLPRVENLYASGRGKAAFDVGPLKVWVPLRWRAYVEPGRQFRWEGELAWFGQPILGGSASIIDGEAHVTEGWETKTGAAVLKSEHTILWLYTLAFAPSALLTLPEITWQPLDRTAARMIFPYGDDEWSFSLFFDPASGTLERLTTHRFNEEIGAFRPYQARFGERRSLGGTSLPASLAVSWVDVLYMTMNVEHVRYNVELPFPAQAARSEG